MHSSGEANRKYLSWQEQVRKCESELEEILMEGATGAAGVATFLITETKKARFAKN